MEEVDIWQKHINKGTDEDMSHFWRAYANCIEELEKTVQEGKAANKVVFVKEHLSLLLEPTVQADFIFGKDG